MLADCAKGRYSLRLRLIKHKAQVVKEKAPVEFITLRIAFHQLRVGFIYTNQLNIGPAWRIKCPVDMPMTAAGYCQTNRLLRKGRKGNHTDHKNQGQSDESCNFKQLDHGWCFDDDYKVRIKSTSIRLHSELPWKIAYGEHKALLEVVAVTRGK